MRKSKVLHIVLLFQYCIFASQSNKTILLPSATVRLDGSHTMVGVNVSIIGLSTNILVAQTSTTNMNTTSRSRYTLLTYQSSTASIQRTSSKDLTHSTKIVPLKSRPTLPQTSTQKNPHQFYTRLDWLLVSCRVLSFCHYVSSFSTRRKLELPAWGSCANLAQRITADTILYRYMCTMTTNKIYENCKMIVICPWFKNVN